MLLTTPGPVTGPGPRRCPVFAGQWAGVEGSRDLVASRFVPSVREQMPLLDGRWTVHFRMRCSRPGDIVTAGDAVGTVRGLRGVAEAPLCCMSLSADGCGLWSTGLRRAGRLLFRLFRSRSRSRLGLGAGATGQKSPGPALR